MALLSPSKAQARPGLFPASQTLLNTDDSRAWQASDRTKQPSLRHHKISSRVEFLHSGQPGEGHQGWHALQDRPLTPKPSGLWETLLASSNTGSPPPQVSTVGEHVALPRFGDSSPHHLALAQTAKGSRAGFSLTLPKAPTAGPRGRSHVAGEQPSRELVLVFGL